MAGLIIGVAAWLLIIGGPVLAHYRLLPPLAGLGAFAVGGLVGFAAAGLGLVQLFRRGDQPFVIVTLALGGLAGLLVLAAALPAVRSPAINDVTTDLEEPPAFTHAPGLPGNEGRDLAYPEGFADIQRRAYPRVAPLTLDAAPSAVYDRALALARARERWEVTWDNREALRFEASAETALFHFTDDMVVTVAPTEAGGALVNMRSKSREGQSDLGKNAERITQFLNDLEASFAGSGADAA